MVDESVSAASLLFIAPPAPPTPPSLPDEPDDEGDGEGGARSRRRRRGRGGSGEAEGGAPQRQQTTAPQRRQREPELITEPQKVKGSTRLEAKKQRRRDGREQGRRRTVVTESEFLARREAVDRAMVVRSKYDRIQVAVLEDDVLVEHYVAKSQEASLIGNIYLGRVQNVLPSMEAAFVDIGRGRNAVLYAGEVDWDAAQQRSGEKNMPKRIEHALKSGDRVLVQVTKDPVGHKGARLTSQISLPGRYLVYVPNGSMSGISRKLPDTERARLKRILKDALPDSAGVIVRTAAEGATEEQLVRDVQRLTAEWATIERAVETANAPLLLHSEPDLLVKIVRDVFNEDFQRLVIDGEDALETINGYLAAVAPDLQERIIRYDGDDSFSEYRISEQIDKALERKVFLPSGGSLVIDRTEAMTVIDVNTGKFVGQGGNLEETVTKNNLEAAEEIVRQLRLRDSGGIIVIDFIDMVLESNRDLVLRRLVECLSRDRTKHQVAEVTSLGLVQMTRKKIGLGLLETFSEPCEVCAGRGVIVHHDPVVKHRAADGGARKGRGGRTASAVSGVKNGVGSAGTHAITEDVRNALSMIAKSTIHPDEVAAAEAAAALEAAAVTVPTLDDVLDALPTSPDASSKAEGPKAASRKAQPASADASEAPPASAPRTRRRRATRPASSQPAPTEPSGE